MCIGCSYDNFLNIILNLIRKTTPIPFIRPLYNFGELSSRQVSSNSLMYTNKYVVSDTMAKSTMGSLAALSDFMHTTLG